MENFESFEKGCEIVLKKCMNLKCGEKLLIITDKLKQNIAEALCRKAEHIKAETCMMIIPVAKVSGEEPPESAANAMLKADVIICVTTESITHTNARIQAVKNGARMATMPGITEEMFCNGAILADYIQVEQTTKKYVSLMTTASKCRIITGKNDEYEVILDISGRNAVPSTGVYKNSGECGNLPSGESYIAPIETGADGKFFVDGSIVGVGKLTDPIIFTLEKGVITSIEGKQKFETENAIPSIISSRTIGELGIGTNNAARLTGIILEDEKIYGSVHLAFGSNTSFGGNIKASSHIDCVTLKPTVYLDDTKVVEKGKLLF